MKAFLLVVGLSVHASSAIAQNVTFLPLPPDPAWNSRKGDVNIFAPPRDCRGSRTGLTCRPSEPDVFINKDLEKLLSSIFSDAEKEATRQRAQIVAFGGRPLRETAEIGLGLVRDAPKNAREIKAARERESDLLKEWDLRKPK